MLSHKRTGGLWRTSDIPIQFYIGTSTDLMFDCYTKKYLYCITDKDMLSDFDTEKYILHCISQTLALMTDFEIYLWRNRIHGLTQLSFLMINDKNIRKYTSWCAWDMGILKIKNTNYRNIPFGTFEIWAFEKTVNEHVMQQCRGRIKDWYNTFV